MNAILLGIAVVLLPLISSAQEEAESANDPLKGLSYKKKLKYADNAFEYGNYFQALELYKQFLEDRPGNNQLFYKVAYCYMEARDYKSAESYFSQSIDAGKTDAETHYYHALMLNQRAQYDAAKSAYSKVVQKEESPWSDWAKKKIEACDFAIEQVKDSVNYRITHFDPPINGPYTEYAPKVFDNSLYYSSLNKDSILNQKFYRENPKHYSRIYKSSKVGSQWAQGAPLNAPFNGADFHSGNYAQTADGNRVYFTKCQDEGNANITCKIYQSTKRGGKWGEAVELGSGVNASKANNTHPAVAPSDGSFDILYFSSDRDGGAGGYDMYSAEVSENGKVSNVSNLGNTINTSGNEKTPFFNSEKDLLYFSSDLHLGLGGYDNFSAQKTEEDWETPVNLGYPINSSADDQYYATGENKKTYYFVSNRPGIIGLKSETCCDDIFQAYDLFVPVFAVKGKLLEQLDEKTAPIKDVVVAVYEMNNGNRRLVALDSIENKSSYFQNLKAEREYEVEFKKPGYFSFTEAISTMRKEESDTFSTDVTLEKIRKDKSYSLSNIYYAYNSAELNEDSKETLDQLYQILKENQTLKFELSSHTDSIGSAGYNQRLSQKRAQACVDYLLEKGVPKDQLIAKGYGEAKPVAPNSKPDGSDNPEGRAKNRRTEYRVIGELEYEGDEIIFEETSKVIVE